MNASARRRFLSGLSRQSTGATLFADHQGSIIGMADGNGARIYAFPARTRARRAINRYDDRGVPPEAQSASNVGRFQFTGQAWLPDLGMYHYKARIYSSTLGRFLQTDPIGYQDQFNLYAYVGNDPVNARDPSGETTTPSASDDDKSKRPPNIFEDPCGSQGGPASPSCAGSSLWFFGSGNSGESNDPAAASPSLGSSLANHIANIPQDLYLLVTNDIPNDLQDLAEHAAKGDVGYIMGNTPPTIGGGANVASMIVRGASVASRGTAPIAIATMGRGGALNSNRYVRVGQGFRQTGRVNGLPVGNQVTRVSIGRQRPYNILGYRIRIHLHIDLGGWPW